MLHRRLFEVNRGAILQNFRRMVTGRDDADDNIGANVRE
jgi:hypothetical protein